jgi:hypothetical protein
MASAPNIETARRSDRPRREPGGVHSTLWALRALHTDTHVQPRESRVETRAMLARLVSCVGVSARRARRAAVALGPILFVYS